MNKLLITGCLLATAFAAVAMPTKKELAAAQKRVEDIIVLDVKALNAGRKTVKDVADIQMKLAADAQSEAEKYLLLQSAFKLYSRGEEFDSAAKALTAISRDIKDVPSVLIVELVDKEFNRDIGLRAPKEIEAAVRDAERFAQVKTEKPQREVVRTDLYCVIDISGGPNAEHYPVSYLASVPDGGWTDEYKTTKIVLRRIDAGTWPMMGNRRVTFAKPFYIGIFELTQKQIKLVSGNDSKKFVFENDMRPADNLTFREMRGKNEEFDYPKTKEVASESIVGRLRAKTGLAQIDLPTSYQFGCAWNAGTDGAGRDACLTGRHFHNQRDGKGGFSSAHTVVGSYQPNEWGIYDLHGNVWEMCLDYAGKQSQEGETDPEGPENGVKRLCRGGGWHSSDRFISADYLPQNQEADESHGWSGCRIVINAMPDEKVDKKREEVRKEQRQTTVDGYTWSYRVNNGEAEIVAEKDGKFSCAVSPIPTESISIPSTLGGAKVTSIGNEAFDGCRELTSVAIPSGVRTIGDNAFRWCALKSVEIPEGVTNIGDRAFRGCGMLTAVLIPSSVTSFSAAPFAWCNQLKKIDVATDSQYFTSVDGVLCTKDLTELVMCPNGLASVTIPESVTSIGPGAFHGCKGLVTLAIPSNVKNIKTWAFAGCRGLTSVTIPASVTNIDDGAFWNCSGLTTITMCGERPSSQKDVFHRCRDLKSIHVPANAKSWAGMKDWQGIPLVFDGQ